MRFLSTDLRTTLTLRLVLAAAALPVIGVATLLAAPGVAHAQGTPVFEGQGLIDLLPPTGLVGDAASPAELYVLALSPSGTALSGLKGKPVATAGTATDLTEVGGGLYKFTFTPPKVTARQDVTFSFKGKLPSKEAVTRSWVVSVAPPISWPVTVASNPAQITLQQDKTATVNFTLQGADSISAANADLRANVSAGSLANLTNLGNGQFSALYTAPAEPFPRIAVITVADRHDPSHTYGAMAIPLIGKADFPVTVAPNARVILKVAGREFGPIQADANGRARVPIVVPPGVTTATRVQITADGKATEEPLDLKIPESKRIALIPSSSAVPGDAKQAVTVRAFVATPDGKPDANAQVQFTATAGTVSTARHEGGGIYVATFTPPNAIYSGTLGLSASIMGSAAQSDSVNLNLAPARAAKVSLLAEPTTLAVSATDLKVTAKVSGPDGNGLPARTLNFTANGAKLKEIKDLKNGDYVATFTTTGSGPAEVSALVATTGSGNPFYRVLLLPARELLPSDGLSDAMLLVATVDEYGYPVPNVGVTLRVASGDGALPATTTTGADGLAQVHYTAGRKVGLVTVEAAAGGTTAAAALVQAPVGVSLPDLPGSGQRNVVNLLSEWAGTMGAVRVERQSPAGMARPVPVPVVTTAANVPATPPSGGTVPAKLQLASESTMIAPGSTGTLRIVLTDAEGKGVAGQSFDFLSSTGTIGAVKEIGGGVYSVALTVPAGAAGEAKVSAATRDGSVSAFSRVAIGSPAAAAVVPVATPVAAPVATVPTVAPTTPEDAWGAEPTSTPTSVATPGPVTRPPAPVTPTPVATTPAPTASSTPAVTSTPSTTSTATVTKTPSESDHPWLRARIGYDIASYAYTQTQLEANSGLFPGEVPWTATAQGVELNVRAFQPSFRYLGLEGGYRAVHYAVDPSALCQKLGRPCEDASAVGDWVTDLHFLGLARYPFESGNNLYWAGARLGYAFGDVEGIQATDNTIDFPQFRVNGLALGAELGVEIGSKLFFTPAFTEYLAGGSAPYDTVFTAELGYALIDQLYVSAKYEMSARKISVLDGASNKVGEISDSLNALTLSVGTQR